MKNASFLCKLISLSLLLTAVSLNAAKAQGKKNSSSMDSLGSGEALMERANPTVPANTYRVVQKRVIDRDFRNEISLSIGGNAGGDSYYETKNAGLRYDFHLSSRWSVGARYDVYANALTSEGKRVFDRAEEMIRNGRTDFNYPKVDQPQHSGIATLSYYPLYGKMSWFDSTVSYFDFYMLGGGGTIKLESGYTPLATAGAGLGMWWNQHLTSRLEVRYQGYNDQANGKRKIDSAVATFAMGFML